MTLAEKINRNEREEKLRIRNEGKIEGRLEGKLEEMNTTIKNMLLLKLDEEIIKQVTGAKDKDLQKIKKELLGA